MFQELNASVLFCTGIGLAVLLSLPLNMTLVYGHGLAPDPPLLENVDIPIPAHAPGAGVHHDPCRVPVLLLADLGTGTHDAGIK